MSKVGTSKLREIGITKCNTCEKSIPEDSVFCPVCGSYQTQQRSASPVCRSCGAPIIDEKAKYCWRCGHNLMEHQSVDEIPPNPPRTKPASTAIPPADCSSANQPKSKSIGVIIGAAITAVLVMLGIAFMVTSNKSEKSFGATSSSGKNASAYVDTAKDLIDKGDYHGALKTITECNDKYPDSKAAVECNSLVSQIENTLRRYEPQNGTTLARTFQYMGSSVLRVTATSGPVVVTISDKKNPSAYATMYVRKGQTAEITVTGGTYRVSYKIGYLWFNDTIGFGDFYEAGSFPDDFKFKIETVGSWISSDVWEITV